MKNEIDNQTNDIVKSTVGLPAGALWCDLRAETGSGNGIEWLMQIGRASCRERVCLSV